MANQLSYSQQLLRRMAPRALRVLDKHADTNPVLQSFGATLRPTADGFIAAYDAAKVSGGAGSHDLVGGQDAVAALRVLVRSWTAPLSRDLPQFDQSRLLARLEVADDVIAAANQLVELAEGLTGEEAGLPYAQSILESLAEPIQRATSEWKDRQAVLDRQQMLQAEVRRRAQALHAELIAFRRVLRTLLGSTHRDYRKLTVGRGQTLTPDEDTAVDLDAPPSGPTLLPEDASISDDASAPAAPSLSAPSPQVP